MHIATIILAAGSSSRLGEPKQLLTNNGKTLVRQITETALSLQTGPVIIVLGANQARIQAELAGLPVQLIQNPGWQEGMASSLRTGLNCLPDTAIDSFLVLLTDQPFVTPALLQELIDTRQKTNRGIVACQYGEADFLGVPALFASRYRSEFMNLSGDVGARKLIKQHVDDCAAVPFPLATVDLDTKQDVENWQSPRSSLPL
ncbi:nucleotidyltransferase family protein [Spirosoma spitsbergense]|uniref:nucleotidyltransferase family protein n=1 Tax=Spirosoma spitsbergense TaxID=431554 RepID=UPI000364BF2F|nr:nucleotidyltransferase family protein [Spirosoma spitsbergense]